MNHKKLKAAISRNKHRKMSRRWWSDNPPMRHFRAKRYCKGSLTQIIKAMGLNEGHDDLDEVYTGW